MTSSDASSAGVNRYVYDPYGQAIFLDSSFGVSSTQASSVGFAYLHQGGRFNDVTKLYHFRNRDYSAGLGRWMQQDPNPRGQYAAGLSLYQYLGSAPSRLLDPFGLEETGVVLNGVTFNPPMAGDLNHPHKPRADNSGPGVPIGVNLGRHSHAKDVGLKYFPEHNVFYDIKAKRYYKASDRVKQDFESQLRNKSNKTKLRWGIALATIVGLACTTREEAQEITDAVLKIEAAIRQGRWGSPDTEGLVAGLANSLGQLFGVNEDIAYGIISRHFDGIAEGDG